MRSSSWGHHRVRHIDTPHVPHGWEARLLFEETTKTLLCGDLFTQLGDPPAISTEDIIGPAAQAEDIFGYSTLSPKRGPPSAVSPTSLPPHWR